MSSKPPDDSTQLILTACPDLEVAERIAQAVVGEGLAACASILPAMRSIYTWKGRTETASEHLVLIKSHTPRYAAIQDRIRTLHPYELPEIIAVRVADGLPEYLSWLKNPEEA